MTPSIADRITIAIGSQGCELRVLRAKLADIERGPFDYALHGLIIGGRFRLCDDGFIRPPTPATVRAATEREQLEALFQGAR